MTIEDNIFKRFTPDFEKLKEYGFSKNGDNYIFEKTFLNDEFKVMIKISNEGKILGTVYDLENDDEYLPLRVESHQGSFAGEVRTAYGEILTNIRNKCFTENLFIYPQSNRIAHLIKEKYGDSPIFLWEKYPDYGVFKNPDNNKWYGVMMNIDRKKLDREKSGEVEILNIKLDETEIQNLLKENGFYPAYHMNKKSWITIVLDETIEDKKIMELIKESHQYTVKRQK